MAVFKVWRNESTVEDLRKGRSGRPKNVRTPENKTVIRELLESGAKTSIRKLSAVS